MMGVRAKGEAAPPVADSTRRREAYFLDYARTIRAVATMPVMVTGGFRSRAAMDEALADGQLDMIGLGRPMCVDTDLPNRLMSGEWAQGESYERRIDPPRAGLAWFCIQLMNIGGGLAPERELAGAQAIERYARSEADAARGLRGR